MVQVCVCEGICVCVLPVPLARESRSRVMGGTDSMSECVYGVSLRILHDAVIAS